MAPNSPQQAAPTGCGRATPRSRHGHRGREPDRVFKLSDDERIAVGRDEQAGLRPGRRPFRLTVSAYATDRHQFTVNVGQAPDEWPAQQVTANLAADQVKGDQLCRPAKRQPRGAAARWARHGGGPARGRAKGGRVLPRWRQDVLRISPRVPVRPSWTARLSPMSPIVQIIPTTGTVAPGASSLNWIF
jgi:hypothetical protein